MGLVIWEAVSFEASTTAKRTRPYLRGNRSLLYSVLVLELTNRSILKSWGTELT